MFQILYLYILFMYVADILHERLTQKKSLVDDWRAWH